MKKLIFSLSLLNTFFLGTFPSRAQRGSFKPATQISQIQSCGVNTVTQQLAPGLGFNLVASAQSQLSVQPNEKAGSLLVNTNSADSINTVVLVDLAKHLKNKYSFEDLLYYELELKKLYQNTITDLFTAEGASLRNEAMNMLGSIASIASVETPQPFQVNSVMFEGVGDKSVTVIRSADGKEYKGILTVGILRPQNTNERYAMIVYNFIPKQSWSPNCNLGVQF